MPGWGTWVPDYTDQGFRVFGPFRKVPGKATEGHQEGRGTRTVRSAFYAFGTRIYAFGYGQIGLRYFHRMSLKTPCASKKQQTPSKDCFGASRDALADVPAMIPVSAIL